MHDTRKRTYSQMNQGEAASPASSSSVNNIIVIQDPHHLVLIACPTDERPFKRTRREETASASSETHEDEDAMSTPTPLTSSASSSIFDDETYSDDEYDESDESDDESDDEESEDAFYEKHEWSPSVSSVEASAAMSRISLAAPFEQSLQSMALVEELTEFAKLPDRLLTLIFSYLPVHARMATIAPVCKQWYSIIKFKSGETLWKHIDCESLFANRSKRSMSQVVCFLDHLLNKNALNQTSGDLSTKHLALVQEQHGFNSELELPGQCANMNAKNFGKLRKVFPNIRGILFPEQEKQSLLSVGSSKSITDACLKQISKLPMLENLKLSTHNKITDEGAQQLLDLSNLSNIVLDYCTGLTSKSFVSLISGLKSLKSLSMLHMGFAIEKNDLIQLPPESLLRELRIDIGRSVDLEAMARLVSSCRQLRTLYIKGFCFHNATQVIELIVSQLPHLKSLTLIGSASRDDGASAKLQAPKIESASLETLQLSRLDVIASPTLYCPSLKSLLIDHCKELSGLSLKHASSLSVLRLRSSSLSSVSIDNIFDAAQSLKELEVFDCRTQYYSEISIRAPQLRKLLVFMCNDIKSLQVWSPTLSSVSIDVCMAMEKLSLHCPSLSHLQLFMIPQILVPRLKHLTVESDRLTTLNLQRTSALETARIACEKLDSLNLASCKHLSEFIELKCPRLDKLALGSTSASFYQNINSWISGCPNVSMLSISNAPLDDEELTNICNKLKLLQALVLSNCSRIVSPTVSAVHLKGVQISECNSLKNFTATSGSLTKLFLRSCNGVTDDTVAEFNTATPTIKFFEIFNCQNIRKPHFALQHLSELHLSKCDHLETVSLTECPQLKKLVLVSCERFTTLRSTSTCLSELMVSECAAFGDAQVRALASIGASLQALIFSKCPLRVPIVPFPNLKVLKFSDCASLVRPIVLRIPTNLSFTSCKSLKLSQLSQLHIASAIKDGTEILQTIQAERNQAPEQLEFIACDSLETLEINLPCKKLNVNRCYSLCELALGPHLQKLQLDQCENLSLVSVCQNSSLEEMSISACPELSHFAFAGKMCLTDLKKVALQDLPRISDIQVTALINQCPSLEHVSVVSCGLTHAAIVHQLLNANKQKQYI